MQTISLPEAQSSLPKLAQAVLSGEWFVIPVEGRNMVLHLADENAEPVPLRPPGYFNECLENDEFLELEIAAAQHCPKTLVP